MLFYFGLVIILALLYLEKDAFAAELYAEEKNITGITEILEIDGLPNPYEIDLAALNMTDYFFDGKESKVIGGVEVPMHYFPFQAALYIYRVQGNGFCGGSLITHNYILTAAHCTARNPLRILVVLGAFDLARNEANQVRLYANKYVYHALWQPSTLQNDIAVIRLPNPVKYTGAIRPIQLPYYYEENYGYEDVKVMIIGWGKTSDYSEITTRLRFVETKVIPHELCSSSITFAYVGKTQICTSSNMFVGACNGDSGGPLVHNGKQLGIVSFGGKSCTAGYPSVFTRVTSYLKWLSTNTDVKIN